MRVEPSLVARVRRTLQTRALLPSPTTVLCACSGGPDSAALLLALSRLAPELGLRLEVASVDHGLRAEAAGDVAIARRQAEQVGVPFHGLQIRVVPGASLQARARTQRYAALAELARARGATHIAVGHTQDDQAETVLARVLRGSGLRGLAAIEPSRADGIVRPLIDCPRAEVHRFARGHFADIARDESNRDSRFERVRIRSHVVPALQAEDAALVRHLAALADDAREAVQLLETLARAALARARLGRETLEISRLACEPRALRTAALRLWLCALTGESLGRAELSELDRALCAGRGEVWLSAAYCVRAGRDGTFRLYSRAGGTG